MVQPFKLGHSNNRRCENNLLIDNGAHVNLVTPEFVKDRCLDVGLIQDLNDHNGCILLCGLGRTMMMGYKLHVITQATYLEDQANLPNGVHVVKTYTELCDGSPNVSVVLHNLMGKPVHLAAWRPVARVVAANAVPDAAPSPEFLKRLDEMEPNQDPPKKLTIEERQKLLLELLRKEGRLNKLKEWPLELALKFEHILMEHHNIFSLKPNEMCTDEGVRMQQNTSSSCWILSPLRNNSDV